MLDPPDFKDTIGNLTPGAPNTNSVYVGGWLLRRNQISVLLKESGITCFTESWL